MNLVQLRRSNDLRTYLAGLLNRAQSGRVESVIVVELREDEAVSFVRAGASRATTIGVLSDLLLAEVTESALRPLERRGLHVGRALSHLRKRLRLPWIPSESLSQEPTPPHQRLLTLIDLLGFSVEGDETEGQLRMTRTQYEELNAELHTDPLGTHLVYLRRDIRPSQWRDLFQDDTDGTAIVSMFAVASAERVLAVHEAGVLQPHLDVRQARWWAEIVSVAREDLADAS